MDDDSKDEVRLKTAWLIERQQSSGPVYFRFVDNDDWTKDHDAAMQFCRERDAQKVIAYFGWSSAKAVEHMWPDRSHLRLASPRRESVEPVAWRWRSVNSVSRDWTYQDTHVSGNEYLEVEPLYAAPPRDVGREMLIHTICPHIKKWMDGEDITDHTCQNCPATVQTSQGVGVQMCRLNAAAAADAILALASPPDSEGPVTIEQLDKLQFGRSLHKRPDSEALTPHTPTERGHG